MISERIKKDEMFKLVTDQEQQNKILGDINIYVPKFMNQLWKNPKSIATILLKADRNDIKSNLANFVVHNLYDFITSQSHKDEQLIYIIALLLKEELKSLKNINNFFFCDKRSAIILEELNKKKEVKSFFKMIMLEIIKKLEIRYSKEEFLFDPNNIRKRIEEKMKNERNKRKMTMNLSKVDKFIEENNIFLDLDEKKLNNKLEEYKDKEMRDFINELITKCKSEPNKYINDILKSQINFEDKYMSKYILYYYKKSYNQVVDILDMLFDNLVKNSELLPYSIRCICKIISIFINKQFPLSSKVEKNKVLVNFFFHTLFFPALINPNLDILINEVLISNLTKEKIQFIFLSILNNITLGELFEKNMFTPFNWYVIEKMPKLIQFLNNICQVTLPPFIEKFVNDELPEDYEYDYFKENPEEDILYRNICYNINELNSLISNAQKFKNDISIDKKLLSKFQLNKKKIDKIRKSVILEEINIKDIIDNVRFEPRITLNKVKNKKKVINYFLLTDTITNNNLNKLLSINQENKKYFNLKELKIFNSEEEKIENDIIKVKNFFFALLYNYPILSKYKYNPNKLTDMINILEELNSHSYKHSSIYKDNNYIPSNWYINSLIQKLPKLPKNLVENDYEELLKELENDITSSIKELNFEKLSIFIEYFKDIEKEKFYYENVKNIIVDIDLNKKAQVIIQTEQIAFDSKSKDNNFVQILSTLMKDKNKKEIFSNFYLKNIKNKTNNTIESFTNYFPNISKYQMIYNIDIYKFIQENKIPEIIDNYLSLIRKDLKEKIVDNERNIGIIYKKIYDYIMEKLYNKLFPKEPDLTDNIIFQNCYKHYWIEFSNLIKEKKNYIFDDYLPDTINYFQQFINEKSPRRKLLCIKKIFNSIYNLGKFNGEEINSADQEMPLLNYAFIKSKPENIYTNCKYTELFLGKKRLEKEGSQLTQLLALCEQMKNISYEKIFNISKENYYKNCNCNLIPNKK